MDIEICWKKKQKLGLRGIIAFKKVHFYPTSATRAVPALAALVKKGNLKTLHLKILSSL